MTNADMMLYVAVAYGAAWLAVVFRAGQFQWFWASVLLWLSVSVLGGKILPNIWGMTHSLPLLLIPFYLSIGSVFFLTDGWKKSSDGISCYTGKHSLLALFAVSSLMMFVVWLVAAALVWSEYPDGLSVWIFPAMIQLYVFKPIYWIVSQAVLMAVFFLHGKIKKQKTVCLSRVQIWAGCLLALLFQAASLFANLFAI